MKKFALLTSVFALSSFAAGCDLSDLALIAKLPKTTYAQLLAYAEQREAALSGQAPVNTLAGTTSRNNNKRSWFHFSPVADHFSAENGRTDLFVMNPTTPTTPNATALRYGLPPELLEPNAYQNIDYVHNYKAVEGDMILVAGKSTNGVERADFAVVFTADEASVHRDVQYVFPATVSVLNEMLALQGVPVTLQTFDDIKTIPSLAEIATFLEEDAASGLQLFDECSDYCADPNDLWLMILTDNTNSVVPTYSFHYLVLVGAANQRDLVTAQLKAQGLHVAGLDVSDEQYLAQTYGYIHESYLPDNEL